MRLNCMIETKAIRCVYICTPELVSHTPLPQAKPDRKEVQGWCGVMHGARCTHPAVGLELRELGRFEAALAVSSYSRQHVAPHQKRAHRRRLLPYHRRGEPCAAARIRTPIPSVPSHT